MNVLVTGGCGFLGSHICERYTKAGHSVVAYDNLSKVELMRTGYNVEAARNYNRDYLKDLGVKIAVEDVRDLAALSNYAQHSDYLIHTAAQPAMTMALEYPIADLETNVLGTVNALEAARFAAIPIVTCSTIHVYGTGINTDLDIGEDRVYHNPESISEGAPLLSGTLTPLHASKRAGEIYTQAYIDSYGLKAANFRLTGMYGPRQLGGEDHGWVANFAIRTALGLPIKIYGTDKQVRDILYVSDAVRAFESFYQNPTPGTYNIGGGSQNIITLGHCLYLLGAMLSKGQRIETLPRRKGDLWYFCSDIKKAKAELNWQPHVRYVDGLMRLVEWVQENVSRFRE